MQKRKHLEKGFVFTFETTISVLLFALILFTIPHHENNTLKELLITQQENDLLRVWSQNYPTQKEILTDTKNLFEKNYSIKLNEKELIKCEGKNKIATEGIILDDYLNENKITIIVCFGD